MKEVLIIKVTLSLLSIFKQYQSFVSLPTQREPKIWLCQGFNDYAGEYEPAFSPTDRRPDTGQKERETNLKMHEFLPEFNFFVFLSSFICK